MVATERRNSLWRRNLCHHDYKYPCNPVLVACEINSYQISQMQFTYKAPFIHSDIGLVPNPKSPKWFALPDQYRACYEHAPNLSYQVSPNWIPRFRPLMSKALCHKLLTPLCTMVKLLYLHTQPPNWKTIPKYYFGQINIPFIYWLANIMVQ
jgi:hypothetical protein